MIFFGEEGFGSFYKGWISPNERSSLRSRVEISDAVKTLNPNGLQDFPMEISSDKTHICLKYTGSLSAWERSFMF
jgi:hypothetical protein